jgi:hypothetical protein
MDSMAPTIEQLRRDTYEAPQRDQKRNQVAYKKLSPFETLAQRGEIDGPQLLAAQKFEMHYWGALGYDVRRGEGSTHEPLEYPQFYHSEMIAAARKVLMLPHLYYVIESQVAENMSLVELGQYLRPAIKRREIARNVAVTMINNGLDILAIHWGQKSRPG